MNFFSCKAVCGHFSGALASLGIALACVSCAPATPSLSRSPLSIDFLWHQPGAVTSALPTSGEQTPAAIEITWNRKDYSERQIASIADTQCGAFDDTARAIGAPTTEPSIDAQKFKCVRMTIATKPE